MPFSMLGPSPGRGASDAPLVRDLSLDRILSCVLRNEDADFLSGFYMSPPSSQETVMMRQAVFRDLDGGLLLDAVDSFSRTVTETSDELAALRRAAGGAVPRLPLVEAVRAVDAAGRQIAAIGAMLRAFSSAELSSSALLHLEELLSKISVSGSFVTLSDHVSAVRSSLGSLSYVLSIKGGTVKASRGGEAVSLIDRVERLFGHLLEGDPPPSPLKDGERLSETTSEKLLGLLSSLYREPFRALVAAAEEALRRLPDPELLLSCRELRFYVSWLRCAERIRSFGLPVSLPRFVGPGEGESCDALYDIALALDIGSAAVASPFVLGRNERIAVLTGPNQGGKTTFARALGQLHHLASLGLPVQGNSSAVVLSDRVITLFSEGEDRALSEGRLEDDIRRFRDAERRSGERSLLIMNELFSSTALSDSLELWSRAIAMIRKRGAYAIGVTFADGASEEEGVVSLVSVTDEKDPAVRTFRIERRPSEGSAHAERLAERYGLSYGALKRGR